ENGIALFLDEQKQTLGGRPVQLTALDSGGTPAGTLAKARELVEQRKVHVIIGPLAAFEAYAIAPYVNAQKVPTISPSAAADALLRAADVVAEPADAAVRDVRREDPRVQEDRHDRRRLRLRARSRGRLPPGVRGRRWPDRPEAVASPRRGGPVSVYRPASPRRRRGLHRVRRSRFPPLPEAVRGRRAQRQDPGARQSDGDRRSAAAQHG